MDRAHADNASWDRAHGDRREQSSLRVGRVLIRSPSRAQLERNLEPGMVVTGPRRRQMQVPRESAESDLPALDPTAAKARTDRARAAEVICSPERTLKDSPIGKAGRQSKRGEPGAGPTGSIQESRRKYVSIGTT